MTGTRAGLDRGRSEPPIPVTPPVATLPDLIQVNVAAFAGEPRAENPAALPAACQGAN